MAPLHPYGRFALNRKLVQLVQLGGAKRIDTKVSILLDLQFPVVC